MAHVESILPVSKEGEGQVKYRILGWHRRQLAVGDLNFRKEPYFAHLRDAAPDFGGGEW